jgi:predicted GTPase
MPRRVLIMGAAGRDFHNFNVVYRNDPETTVVAFTATQIPFINDRKYPAQLAGSNYPDGIQIYDESELDRLIRDLDVDDVVFAYSDVSHVYVMHKASQATAAGANFQLLGPDATMLEGNVPIVAVCAVRTGSGKSQTTRRVAQVLRDHGKTPVVVRHPMPYGDLVAQRVQRFGSYEDLDTANVTIEEREEYEPHLSKGTVVYAGVDYGEILEQAQKECDVLLWDGGNNDIPFYRPTVHITVADPLRAGHEQTYYPGETNFRMADVIVINKVDSATPEQVAEVRDAAGRLNPLATIVFGRSPVTLEDGADLNGKRVLVIEDGPTLTHGEMQYGAGVVAAKQSGAAEIVDPREYAVGTMKDIYAKYSIGPVLPAMGYSDQQLHEFEHMINTAPADAVIIATPIDLRRLVKIEKPAFRAFYDLEEDAGSSTIEDVLKPVL